MTNTVLFAHLIEGYNKLAFTHNYIYGFCFQNMVYMVKATAEDMPFVLKLDKASRGAGYALRFKPNKAQKTFLLAKGATAICSKEFFEATVKESKYNRGEIFEKMVTEFYGQVWEKDNIPFTDDGDLTVDGVAYQIKFEKATFTNEKSLARMMQHPCKIFLDKIIKIVYNLYIERRYGTWVQIKRFFMGKNIGIPIIKQKLFLLPAETMELVLGAKQTENISILEKINKH